MPYREPIGIHGRPRSVRGVLSIIVVLLLELSCSSQKREGSGNEVHRSKDLRVTQLTESCFLHTSFKRTEDFGLVPCNGLIVKNGDEVIVFDTPTNDRAADALIAWIQGTLHCRINAVVPTHFHDDCLGGLQAFHDRHIPSYAHTKTISLAKQRELVAPQNGFEDSLSLNVGAEQVTATYFGEGHTQDNIVGYFAPEHVLFGGCLIKERGASKGYLGDANVAAWSATVERVKQAYPQVEVVVPGHGQPGNKDLLDLTIQMFRTP